MVGSEAKDRYIMCFVSRSFLSIAFREWMLYNVLSAALHLVVIVVPCGYRWSL